MSGINFKDTVEKRLENLCLHFRRWRFFICGNSVRQPFIQEE